ncbi:MAG: hypothetical protein ACJ77K_17960 [Bacteroidia bacterium]
MKTDAKDTSFEFSIAEANENFLTELWVSDPECTECKDCYVDSGVVKVPAVLTPYIKWPNDYFLIGNNPYVIENTYYVSYRIKGRIVGVKYGRPVFCVDSYKEIV